MYFQLQFQVKYSVKNKQNAHDGKTKLGDIF